MLFAVIILAACKNQEKLARAENTKTDMTVMKGSVPAGEVKKSKEPIPMSACRVNVTWQETGEGDNSCVVEVVDFLGTGPSYAGLTPKRGDLLMIHELTKDQFVDRDTLKIDLQPFLNQRDNSSKTLPELTMIQIVNNK